MKFFNVFLIATIIITTLYSVCTDSVEIDQIKDGKGSGKYFLITISEIAIDILPITDFEHFLPQSFKVDRLGVNVEEVNVDLNVMTMKEMYQISVLNR